MSSIWALPVFPTIDAIQKHVYSIPVCLVPLHHNHILRRYKSPYYGSLASPASIPRIVAVVFIICLYCHHHHHYLRCAPQNTHQYVDRIRKSQSADALYTAVLQYMFQLRDLKLGVRRHCIARIRSPRVYCNCTY